MNKDYYDDILGDDKLEPEELGVVHVDDKPLHWSEQEKLGYRMEPREPYELGDEMADHSDDQGYDNFKEEDDE